MAGIGFELRRLSNDNSIINLLRANFYAGVLSSGSWIISISVLIAIYFYLVRHNVDLVFSIQFLVTVTYLVSSSLIFSAVFQQAVNRYIADQIFRKKYNRITPGLFTSSLIIIVFNAPLGYTLTQILLTNQTIIIKLVIGSSFVVLNIIWLFANSLTGLKNYRFILFSYIACYSVVFFLAINFYQYHFLGLVCSFYIGHVILMVCFLLFALKNYPARQLFSWDILGFLKHHRALVYGSVLFQLGVWVDKYCFWILKGTSTPVIDSLRSSPIYDMPMFVAFILMIPGITMLFYEIEANFSRYYHLYYDAIREGGTLHEIDEKHVELVSIARYCFINVILVQIIMSVLAAFFAPEIFKTLGLAPIFIFLFRVDIVSVGLLVLLISQINFLYYLNKAEDVQWVSLLFFILNLTGTLITFQLGPLYYGYGFAVALFFSNILAALKLRKAFEKLTFHSFMPTQR